MRSRRRNVWRLKPPNAASLASAESVMSFFVNKLGPLPDGNTNVTHEHAERTAADRDKLAASRAGTAAPAVAVAQASAQMKAQQAQGGNAPPPPAPAPEPEKKKKGWF